MSFSEAGIGIGDVLVAEMVECVPPDPPAEPSTATPVVDPGASPVAAAQDATIEQTGAGPPPERA